MHAYKDRWGSLVDLDKSDLFKKWEPYCKMKTWGEFHLECIQQLGYALVYVNYLYPDVDFGSQVKKIKKLCKELHDNERFGDISNGAAGRNPDIKFWRGFLYRVLDETENMC